MGRFGVMSHEPSGVSAWLIYNDQNLRVQQAGWDNPSPSAVRLWIWDNGALVHETVLEPGVGSRNVPGNYRLQQVDDPIAGPALRLPTNVTYRMQWPG